jgi:hypothetical protein
MGKGTVAARRPSWAELGLAFFMAGILAAFFSGCGPRVLVRECGALVGGHFDAQAYDWVQPCARRDQDGCANRCRPASSRCEAAQAAFREEPRGQTMARVDALAKEIEEACR